MYGIHDNKRLGAFQTVPQFLADERDKEAICKKKSSLFKWSVGGLDSHTEREKNFLNVVLGSRTKEQVKSFILRTLVSNVMAEFYRRAMRENMQQRQSVAENGQIWQGRMKKYCLRVRDTRSTDLSPGEEPNE